MTYRTKPKTLAHIRRSPLPGAKGYKVRRDEAKPEPGTDTGWR